MNNHCNHNSQYGVIDGKYVNIVDFAINYNKYDKCYCSMGHELVAVIRTNVRFPYFRHKNYV